MKRILEIAGREAHWKQPHALAPEYELRAGDDVAATLVFRSTFGSLATGTSADGCWTFKRLGFVSTSVTVRACGSETDLAVFRNNTWTGGGTLEFLDGRTLRANTNFWMTRYQLTTDTEAPLIAFSRIGGLLHVSCAVEVHDAARSMPELPWLVMLGWYLAIMMHRDAAVVAAGT
jgi:hypothetical protein